MSEENKAVIRRFFNEALSTGNAALFNELCAPDYRLTGFGLPLDRDAAGQFLGVLRTGFPDRVFSIDDLLAEGDRAATRYTVRGTHRGDFQGVPPTGKPVSINTAAFYRFSDGKIGEEWVKDFGLELMQQIGAIPDR